MQDRYVGDIGDYAKYALLRALSPGKKLGIAWYLHPDESSADGGHIEYLKQPDRWEYLDAELFRGLAEIVDSNRRCVKAVEESNLLPGAVFASERFEHLYEGLPPSAWRRRRVRRESWFDRVMEKLSGCDIVFADPDNGLCCDDRYSSSQCEDWKRLPLSEAKKLAEGQTAILYHHNTRFEGGHKKEIQYWMDKLPGHVYAFYWRRVSPRTFFVVNPDQTVIGVLKRFKEFKERWRQHGELISTEL